MNDFQHNPIHFIPNVTAIDGKNNQVNQGKYRCDYSHYYQRREIVIVTAVGVAVTVRISIIATKMIDEKAPDHNLPVCRAISLHIIPMNCLHDARDGDQ